MDLEEARRWFASSESDSLQSDLESDVDEAIDTHERTLSRMGTYPSSVTSEYRRAAQTLTAAGEGFNRAVNDLTSGRARDGRAALGAYRTYVAALLRLQGLNARYAAFVEADVARLIEAFFTAGERAMRGRIRRESRAMMRALDRLQDRLERARREADEARVQRAINLVLNGIGIALGFATGVEEAAIAYTVGSAVLSTALDFALGPGSPDEFAGAVTSVGTFAGLAEGVGRTVSTVTGSVTGFLGFLADNDEVATADRNLAGIDRELTAAHRLFRDYCRMVASESSDMTLAKRLAEGAIRNARARARAYREAEGDWQELERVLSEIR